MLDRHTDFINLVCKTINFRSKEVIKDIAIAEVPIPKAVLINASEIPIDNAAASGVPPPEPKAKND